MNPIGLHGFPPLGVGIDAAGAGPERFERMVSMATRAEEVGFDSVWTNELYSHSATIAMAVFSYRTSRVKIASGIAYGVGRSPLMWVAEARDLDELSGGRLMLGLGNGTARMMEDWHGVSGEAPAVRMEELVEVMRKLWRLDEGPVKHEGRFYRVDLSPTADTPPPFREHLPIYTAGVNDRMIEVAGRVADGLCGHPMFTALYLDEVVRPALAKGAVKRGRDPGEIAIVHEVMCVVDEDLELAREQLAFAIAQYAASRVYVRLFDLHGWSGERELIAEAVRAGDRAAAIAAVSDEMVDEIGVACRPGELVGALARHSEGVDHLMLTPAPWGLTRERTEQQISTIIDGFAPAVQTMRSDR
jgi:probable F420-dependent oxidoreductase